MACRNQCRPPFGMVGKPCDWCAERYERLMDESYERMLVEQSHRFWISITPATDQEWRDHLDQVAPVVKPTNPLSISA
jgi:hypothetical protein